MFVLHGVLVSRYLDAIRTDRGQIFDFVARKAAVGTCRQVPFVPAGAIRERQGIGDNGPQIGIPVCPAVGRFFEDIGVQVAHAGPAQAAGIGQRQ